MPVLGGTLGFMTAGRLLADMEAVAARLGVVVRSEPFGKGLLQGRGGLCWVDGKALVVMDEKLGREDRIGVLAEALAKLDLGAVALTEAVRERIDAARRRGKKRGARKKPKPGLARAKPRKG
jgi:hypothetical protein